MLQLYYDLKTFFKILQTFQKQILFIFFCIFSLGFLLGGRYCEVKFYEIPPNIEESHCAFVFGNCKDNWASPFCVVE